MDQETASASSVDLKAIEGATKTSNLSERLGSVGFSATLHGDLCLTDSTHPIAANKAVLEDVTEQVSTAKTSSMAEWKGALESPFGEPARPKLKRFVTADLGGSSSSIPKGTGVAFQSPNDSHETIWLYRQKSGHDGASDTCCPCRSVTEKQDAGQSYTGASQSCIRFRSDSAESAAFTDATEGTFCQCRGQLSLVNDEPSPHHPAINPEISEQRGSIHHFCCLEKTHSCGFTCESASSEKAKPATMPFSEKATSYSLAEPGGSDATSNRCRCLAVSCAVGCEVQSGDINSLVTLKTPSHTMEPSYCKCSDSKERCPMCDGTLRTEDFVTEDNTRSIHQESHSWNCDCAPVLKIKPCLKKPSNAKTSCEEEMKCSGKYPCLHMTETSVFKAAPGYSTLYSADHTDSAISPTLSKSEPTKIEHPRMISASVQIHHRQWEQKTGPPRGKPLLNYSTASSSSKAFDQNPLEEPGSDGFSDTLAETSRDKDTALSTCESLLPGLNRAQVALSSEIDNMKKAIEDSVTRSPDCPDIIAEEPNCVNCMLQGMQNEEVVSHSPYYSHIPASKPSRGSPPPSTSSPPTVRRRPSIANGESKPLVDQIGTAEQFEKSFRQADQAVCSGSNFKTTTSSSLDTKHPAEKKAAKKEEQKKDPGALMKELASCAKTFTETWRAVQGLQFGTCSPPQKTVTTSTSTTPDNDIARTEPEFDKLESYLDASSLSKGEQVNRCDGTVERVSAVTSRSKCMPVSTTRLPTAEEMCRCLEIVALEAEIAHCGKQQPVTAGKGETGRQEGQQQDAANSDPKTELKPVTSKELENLEDLRGLSELLKKECRVSGQLDVPECGADNKKDVDMMDEMAKELMTIRAPDCKLSAKQGGSQTLKSPAKISAQQTSVASPDPCQLPALQNIEINYEKLAREIRQQAGITDFNIRDVEDPEKEADKFFRGKCPTCEPSNIVLSTPNQEVSPRSLRDSVALSSDQRSPGGSEAHLLPDAESGGSESRYRQYGSTSIGTVEPRCTECLIKLPIGKAHQNRSRTAPTHTHILSQQRNVAVTRIGESLQSTMLEMEVSRMTDAANRLELEMPDEDMLRRKFKPPTLGHTNHSNPRSSAKHPPAAHGTSTMSPLLSPPSPPSIPDVPQMPSSSDKRFTTYTVGEGLKMTKTMAHDNITTPNVPLSGYAYAFPRLSKPGADSMVGARDTPKPAYGVAGPSYTYKGEKIPPNCISIVPATRTRMSPASRH